jgi:hypothetical protein
MSASKKDEPGFVDRAIGSIVVLAIGVGSLAFLVAIDRPHWFELRPVSGAAAAMAAAASRPAAASGEM